MAPSKTIQYGSVTLLERILLLRHIVLLPLHILWAFFLRLLGPSFSGFAEATWKRTLSVVIILYTTGGMPTNQLQYLFGTSSQVYQKWTKANGLPAVVDELEQNASLFWIGPKETDHVILYLHGGTYFFGVPDFAMSFLLHYQQQVKKNSEKRVGIAVLSYTLIPDAVFPTQLAQMQTAIAHLIEKEGVLPKNLQLFGDSAGGNLVWQFVSQSLHPHKDLPFYQLPSKLGGIYFMSPWFDAYARDLDLSDPTIRDRFKKDAVPVEHVPGWGQKCFGHVREEHKSHVDPINPPAGWLDDLGKVSSRWLVTAGSGEVLSGAIIKVYEKQFKPHEGKKDVDVKFYLQANGIHDDGLLDFLTNDDPENNDLSKLVWAWFSEGLQ